MELKIAFRARTLITAPLPVKVPCIFFVNCQTTIAKHQHGVQVITERRSGVNGSNAVPMMDKASQKRHYSGKAVWRINLN